MKTNLLFKFLKCTIALLIMTYSFSALANRDAVTAIDYAARIDGPYNISVSTLNTACDTTHTYSWDIIDLLTVTSDSAIDNAVVNNAWSYIEIHRTLSTLPPSATWRVILSSMSNVILNRLWVPWIARNNYNTIDYQIKLDVQLKLNTNSNWWSLWTFNQFYFSAIASTNYFIQGNEPIKYYDHWECSSDPDKVAIEGKVVWDVLNAWVMIGQVVKDGLLIGQVYTGWTITQNVIIWESIGSIVSGSWIVSWRVASWYDEIGKAVIGNIVIWEVVESGSTNWPLITWNLVIWEVFDADWVNWLLVVPWDYNAYVYTWTTIPNYIIPWDVFFWGYLTDDEVRVEVLSWSYIISCDPSTTCESVPPTCSTADPCPVWMVFWNYTPAEIVFDSLTWCSTEGGKQVCYAFTWALNLNVHISQLWGSGIVDSYGNVSDNEAIGIDWLLYNVNNCANTGALLTWSIANISPAVDTIWTIISKDFNFVSIFKQAWCYNLEIQWRYWANTWFNTNVITIPLEIIANNNLKLGSLDISSSPTPDYYANNSDEVTICQTILDEYDNPINNLVPYIWESATLYWTWLDTDSTNTVWDSEWLVTSSPADFTSSKLCWKIKSKAPWKKDLKYIIKVPEHKQQLNLAESSDLFESTITVPVTFLKPITWLLKILSASNFTMWSMQRAKINLSNIGGLSFVDLSNTWTYALEKFEDSFGVVDTVNYKIHSWSLYSETEMDFSMNYIVQNREWDLRVKAEPEISYEFPWVPPLRIKYFLSSSANPNDRLVTSDQLAVMKWISVSGNSQWKWNLETANIKTNFTDLSTSSQRSLIKQKVQWLIKGRQANSTKLNWIYLTTWDIILSSALATLNNNDTIVVKNGNLSIDTNITWKNIWIVVFRDSNSDDSKWNVYVSAGLKEINAFIYADWALLSWESDFTAYDNTVDINHTILNNQLVFKWFLFTRNTIWWALYNSSNIYKMPGGATTTDFDKAMRVDLNYIRRENIWHNDSSWTAGINQWKKENFVILPNPTAQSNPPKWF